MSAYQHRHDVYRLFGSPPGYIGYEDTSFLDKISETPGSRVVFEEISKANPEILAMLFYRDKETGRISIKPQIELPDGRIFSFGKTEVIIEQPQQTLGRPRPAPLKPK